MSGNNGQGHLKIFRFEDRFPGTGEPTVQLLTKRDLTHVKLASEAGDYIRNVDSKPGKTIVLVLAMSAGEFYGPNRNGDAFSERVVPGKVEKGETLPDHFKSFESGAKVYRHHINKDPEKSMGNVLKAFYNWEMHRVELLLELDDALAADVVEKINNGEFPAVSMGCRIKYDVCDVCGNKAPTRAQYCDHAKYEMNRVYPDGRKSFVWNPSPKLFDISFVIRPADRIGFMMKKVAHDMVEIESAAELGEKVADVQEKVSTLRKLSEIDKIITGQAVAATPPNNAIKSFCQTGLPKLMENTPGLDQDCIGELAQHPLPEALSSLGAMGITPTTNEMAGMMVQRAVPGAKLPGHVQDNMASMQGPVLEMLAQHPEILEALEASGLLSTGPEHVNPELVEKLSSWREKRSNAKEYLERRIFNPSVFPAEASPDIGNWDIYNVTDPSTGQAYKTTRGAIDRAEDADIGRQLKTLAGASLLTGAGYKALSAHKGGRMYAPLALAAGGIGAMSAMKHQKVPSMKADPGAPEWADKVTGEKWTTDVPMNSEMRKAGADMASVAMPLASSAAVTAMLAQEYNARKERGQLGTNPSLSNRIVENLGDVANTHPGPMFLAGLGGIAAGSQLAAGLGKFIVKSADSVKLAEVDLEGLSYWLGDRLFSVGR